MCAISANTQQFVRTFKRVPPKLHMKVKFHANKKIKSVINVNPNKFQVFAEETCNMYHNSTEVDHSTKETFTRLAKTDSSPLELMQ